MIVDRFVGQSVKSFLPNFLISDFFCRCGKCKYQNINMKAALMLQKTRDLRGAPIIVNEAFRCPEYNRSIGGAPRSKHLDAIAYDIKSPGVSGFDLALVAYKAGFRRFGIARNWCHIDDAQPVGDFTLWVYGAMNLDSVRRDFADAIKK